MTNKISCHESTSPPVQSTDPRPVYDLWIGVHVVKGLWTGKGPVPAIGDKISINFNSLGSGVVERYFVEDGYLGVRVKLLKRPDWHVKQNGKHYKGLSNVFGNEINTETTAKP